VRLPPIEEIALFDDTVKFQAIPLVMNPRRIPAVLLLISLMTAHVCAQTVLMTANGQKMSWVRAASGSTPCIEVDGKVQPIAPQGYVLKPVSEYRPVLVNVRNPYTRVSYGTTDTSVASNKMLVYSATLETGYRLDDVFVVTTLGPPGAYSSIVLSQVDHLVPNQERQISVSMPLGATLGSGGCQLHVFSGGLEVINSEILPNVREAALDTMVAARLKGVHAAGLRLFFGPPPEYPASLKSANLKGQATIAIHIGKNGAVSNPVVRSATDPAFGDAALAAVQMWRFLPGIKDDQAVETQAVVPFTFEQPKRS
jgi:TonB family protein